MVLSERDIDWGVVYREHAPRLRGLIARRVPGAAVDDVLQDTFVRAYRGRHRLDTSRPLWPFLATLAKRSSIQWHRSHPDLSRSPAEPANGSVLGDFPGSDEHLAGYVEARRVVEVLAGLTPRHRRILFLHGVQDHGCDAIAAADQLSEKAVRSLLDRARANFRATYRGRHDRPLIVAGVGRHWWLRLRHRIETLPLGAYECLSLLATGTAISAVVALLNAMPYASRVVPPTSAALAVGTKATEREPVESRGVARSTPNSAPLAMTTSADPTTSATAPELIGRTPSAAQPVTFFASAELVNGPGESTKSFTVEISVPVNGITITAGSTVYCDRAQVATLECMALRILPPTD
ncbi:MAG: sigma-70 family RNA polymerase sigma factor [Actinomycetota bacterium]|nr:sigma-70 family RNA polymerase sigma factor [Actinomycetota bacterium]